jgi:hypothetical protein
MKLKKTDGKNAYIDLDIKVNNKPMKHVGSTADILFASMYENYLQWFEKYKNSIG